MKIVHPNVKNSGAILEITFHLTEDRRGGVVYMSIAPQKTVAAMEGGKKVAASFDYSKRIGIVLSLMEVGSLVAMLSGRKPVGEDDAGFVHRSQSGTTAMGFRGGDDEKYAGRKYLSFYRKMTDGTERKCGISLTPDEQFALKTVLGQSMFHMAFGMEFEPLQFAKEGKKQTSQEKE